MACLDVRPARSSPNSSPQVIIVLIVITTITIKNRAGIGMRRDMYCVCLAAKLFLEPMTNTLFAEQVRTLTSPNRRFEGAASRRQPTLKWNDRQKTSPCSAPQPDLQPAAKRPRITLHVRPADSVQQRALEEYKKLTKPTCLNVVYGVMHRDFRPTYLSTTIISAMHYKRKSSNIEREEQIQKAIIAY